MGGSSSFVGSGGIEDGSLEGAIPVPVSVYSG